MKVWSIKTLPAWQILQHTGVLRTNPALVEPLWRNAYWWMARQLTSRVGPAPPGCEMPIWVWCRWSGYDHAKPDLRYNGHLPRGMPGVRLTLSIAPERLLCSDFDLWHYPLNGWYLAATVEESRTFETYEDSYGFPNDRFTQQDLERSWERIFDLNWEHPEFTHPCKDKSIQAVLWEVHLDDVVMVEHFVAR